MTVTANDNSSESLMAKIKFGEEHLKWYSPCLDLNGFS